MLKAPVSRYLPLLFILIVGFSCRFYQKGDLGFYQGHNWEQVSTGLAWGDLTAYLFEHLAEIADLSQRQISTEEIRAAWDEEITPDLRRFGDGFYTIVIRANWPVQIFLNTLALKFMDVEIMSLGLLAALFGWLCIPVYYFLGRSFADHQLGVVSALLVAVSAFAVILSRTVYDGQQFVPFFCGLILALYLQSAKSSAREKAYLVGTGIVGGLGIGVQPVVMPFFGSLLLYELLVSIRGGVRRNSGRLLALGAGLVLTLVALELPYALVGGVLGKNVEVLYPGFRSFWGNFFYLVDQINYERNTTLSVISLLATYFIYETALSSVLFLVGLAMVARQWRTPQSALLISLLVLPTLYWILISRNPPEPRHFLSAVFPVLILLAAMGFTRVCSLIADRWPGRAGPGEKAPLIAAVGLVVVLGVSFGNLMPIYRASTGLQQAAHWLKQKGADRLVVFGECASSFQWLQYDIRTECVQGGESQSRYLAAMPRYASAPEKDFLAGCDRLEIKPVYEVSHFFPLERMYEHRAAQSAFMRGLASLPVIGSRLEQIRLETVAVNAQRKVALFDMSDSQTERLLREVCSRALSAQPRQEYN